MKTGKAKTHCRRIDEVAAEREELLYSRKRLSTNTALLHTLRKTQATLNLTVALVWPGGPWWDSSGAS